MSHSPGPIAGGNRAAHGREQIVSVLDIGTSKICCVIGRLSPGKRGTARAVTTVEILGMGYHLSRGIKGGVVIDMDAAEQAIRGAVDRAERDAGMDIEQVHVLTAGGRPRSECFTASIGLAGETVDDTDISRVLSAGRDYAIRDRRSALHVLPTGYGLGAERDILDPRGMLGDRLNVDVHAVTADPGPLRNLTLCIERCHLTVEALIAAPFAAGLATMVADEKRLGSACIDMGGGTTSLAVFAEGHLVHVDAIAVGGRHLTNDLARGLSIPWTAAERLKTLYASALRAPSDEQEMVAVPVIGENESPVQTQVPRAVFTGIIRPRLKEIFQAIDERIAASGLGPRSRRRIVLTGGASQLTGIREMALHYLGKQVRLGRPARLAGLPEFGSAPDFAAAAGGLLYPLQSDAARSGVAPRPVLKTGTGYFTQFTDWIRESF